MSSDRLAHALRGDIADLQVQLEETILRSEAYLAAGLTDQASAVVDEQQELLSAMHRRIDGHVAAASIEADAESILADSLVREMGARTPTAEPEDERVTPLRAARSAASVLVGAVAAVALMIMASSPPGPSTFAAAGVQDERETDGTGGVDTDGDDQATDGTTRSTADERDRVAGPNDLEVRRLFSTPGPNDTDPEEPVPGPELPVLQLQALVANVVSTVEVVAEAARDGWERALSERPEQQQADAPQDQRAETDEGPAVAEPARDDSSGATATDEPAAESAPASDRPADEDADDDATPQDDGAPADEVEERVGGTVAHLEQ